MDVYKPVYPGLYYFDTFTFTTMGTSGLRGPDSTRTYANAPWRDSDFSIVDGQQQWTVPASGTYRVTAAGAYGAKKGRVVSGEVDLNEGQVLSLLVGQMPSGLAGGGGGTFIVSDGKPLIVASGGDGTGGHDASFSPYGSGNGINGAGYFTNGSNFSTTYQFLKPTAYINGGFGNSYEGYPLGGGFGGGQTFVYPPEVPTSITMPSSQHWVTIGVNSAGRFVAFVENSTIAAYSDDGINWTQITMPFYGNWNAVAVNSSGRFIVISYELAAYSDDGINWFSLTTMSPSAYWTAITVNSNGRFVVVAQGSDISSYSDDGINWTDTILPFNTYWQSITVSSSGRFVAIAISYGKAAYSDDGINWFISDIFIPPYYYWRAVVVNSTGRFVAVPQYGYNQIAAYSDDGINWSQSTTIPSASWSAVTVNSSGRFVAIANDVAAYSDDGINWIQTTMPSSQQWRAVAVSSQDLFVVVNENPYVNLVANSDDGISWFSTLPLNHIPGGGGYTGSPGNRMSGATCYGAGTITDLGATSNSAGYVTVSLVDPAPITQVYDDTIVRTEIYVSTSGFAYWSDIAYSPELKMYVTCSSFYNGQGIAYSTDGKQWFRSDYDGQGPLALSWSPELGIFITGKGYRIYTSSNGKNWILASDIDFFGFTDVIWVQFLHEFICITTIDTYSSFYKSPDGINWYPIVVSPPVYYGYYGQSVFAASPDTVIACLSTYVYTSTDGDNWTTSLTTSNNIETSAYGNGIFLVVTDSFEYYYSTDKGQTWSNGTLPYTNIDAHISSVYTDSFIVTGNHETFTSRDCVTWTRYQNNIMIPSSYGYNSIAYNSTDNYAVAVSDREINLTLDGSIWIPADTTFIGAVYDNVAYSPETNTVVAVASNGQVSTETGVYTKDGVNWKRIPGLSFYPKVCRWNPLQNLFFLDSYAFDPVSETLSQQYSYREWIESTTPPQLLQSYYDQGLNNSLIGNVFSLSGIFVSDSGSNQSQKVSCSGETFIKFNMYQSPGVVYKSTDGVNWVQYQLQGDIFVDCRRIIYVSKYKAFFVLSSQQVYKSYDGVSWSMVYQTPGIYLFEMIWCQTLNKLLLFSIANNLIELTFST